MVLAFVIQNRSYGVAFSVVHAETSGAASEAVALGSEVLAVAGVAEHLAVMLADAAGVKELLAVGCKEKKAVLRNVVRTENREPKLETSQNHCNMGSVFRQNKLPKLRLALGLLLTRFIGKSLKVLGVKTLAAN